LERPPFSNEEAYSLTLPIDTKRFLVIEAPVLRGGANPGFWTEPGVVSLAPVSYAMPAVRPGFARRVARRLHLEALSLAEKRWTVRWVLRAARATRRYWRWALQRGYSRFRSRVVGVEWSSSPAMLAPPRSRQCENDVFLYPQTLPEREVLPPIVERGLDPDKVCAMFQQRAAIAVFQPIGMLAKVPTKTESASRPLVVLHPELAAEATDAFGPWTISAARETAWWSRLAGINVFTSEHDRRMAIQLYGLRIDRTRVVSGSLVARGLDRTPALAPGPLPVRDFLPERYILGVNSRTSQANVLLLFQALQILLWRGNSRMPLVLHGEASGRFPSPAKAGYEEALDAAGIAADLTPGQNLFLLPPLPESALGGIEANALMSVVTDRWSANACLKVCSAAMQRCPVIAVASPGVEEEWGPSDHAVLLVPPDDPAALADAIQYTLDRPAATAQRVDRAYCLARTLSDPQRLDFLQQLLEEVAEAHAATNVARVVRRAA
jgi:glycosyltransferase involved in cell wall biosynthesis